MRTVNLRSEMQREELGFLGHLTVWHLQLVVHTRNGLSLFCPVLIRRYMKLLSLRYIATSSSLPTQRDAVYVLIEVIKVLPFPYKCQLSGYTDPLIKRKKKKKR